MAKSKKHQKSRSRKTAKRKSKRTRAGLLGLTGKRSLMRQAGAWPLMECLIAEEWRQPGEIIQIAIVRQSKSGQVAVGGFLVDLGCLGVKNALAVSFPDKRQYRKEYRATLMASQPMVKCELDLAAKVVDEAIKYANSLGFKPHRDSRDAFLIMGEAHPENCDEEVPLGGEDGKPLFVAGPYDNPDRIMRILDRKVGRGNYHFMAPIGGAFGIDDLELLDELEDFE